MNQTTPVGISDEILTFCREIDPSTNPTFVDVIPTKDSKHQDCFSNVESHIKEFGGNIGYGWTIWESPNLFIEAEFHAVWIDNKRKYIDITPKKMGRKKFYSFLIPHSLLWG